jgi:hypothetical protein
MRRWLILWTTLVLVALVALAVGPLAYDRRDLNHDGEITLTDLVRAESLENEIIEHLKGG